MSNQNPPEDISMDEIMASIRRIMTEEEPPAAQPNSASTIPPPAASNGDIQRMTKAATPSATAARPNRPSPIVSRPTAAPTSSSSSILSFLREKMGTSSTLSSAQPSSSMGMAKQSVPMKPMLNSASARPSNPTLESVAIEALRPLLKEWMAQNLRPLVESIIQREVQKMLKDRKS